MYFYRKIKKIEFLSLYYLDTVIMKFEKFANENIQESFEIDSNLIDLITRNNIYNYLYT